MSLVNIDRNRCKGCELCVGACPQGVLAMSRKINVKGYFPAEVAEPCRCIGCRLCAITCPDVAIDISVQGAQYVFFDY
jgi:2-oxoglutarate ferredoxin oxidoreductase subunit delta